MIKYLIGYRAILAVVLALMTATACSTATATPTDSPVSEDTPTVTTASVRAAKSGGQASISSSARTPSPTVVATPAEVLPTPTRPLQRATLSTERAAPATPSPTVPPSPAAATVLGRLPDVAGVVERTRPAVVSVVTEVLLRDFFGRVFTESQNGSGFIFDPEGYILTNNHVVESARRVTVTLDDGTQLDAKVVGTDRLTDLAVLKIEGDSFPSVPLGDPDEVRAGDFVIAIGNALALPGGPTVTFGVISALDRIFEVRPGLQLDGLIQTDASINPGNSGGPLLNLQGEVVGINTAVARGDASGREVEGISFAVGMETAVSVGRQLVDEGRVHWAWFGAVFEDLDPRMAAEVGIPIRGGVVVAAIVRDGPARRAGVRAGDVVISMGGEKTRMVRELIRQLRFRHTVGETVELKVYREGKEIALEMTLGERPRQ